MANSIEHEPNPHWVDSRLDDYGLTPQQFRVHGHIARRGDCYASLENMAKACRMHRDTVIDCLRFLLDRGLVSKETRPGQPSIYRQTLPTQWAPAGNEGAPETKGHLSKSGKSHRKRRGTYLPETKGHKGNPIEGNPTKENGNGATVVAPQRSPLEFFLTLDRKEQRIWEELKKLAPDRDANFLWWKSCMEEDADCLSGIITELRAAILRGVEIDNPGGWITTRWKQIGGEENFS